MAATSRPCASCRAGEPVRPPGAAVSGSSIPASPLPRAGGCPSSQKRQVPRSGRRVLRAGRAEVGGFTHVQVFRRDLAYQRRVARPRQARPGDGAQQGTGGEFCEADQRRREIVFFGPARGSPEWAATREPSRSSRPRQHRGFQRVPLTRRYLWWAGTRAPQIDLERQHRPPRWGESSTSRTRTAPAGVVPVVGSRRVSTSTLVPPPRRRRRALGAQPSISASVSGIPRCAGAGAAGPPCRQQHPGSP